MIKANECLLESFSEMFNILDSKICNIEIKYEQDMLIIDICLILSYPQNLKLNLRFKGVKEYSFYWNENYIFYNIESFKLFKTENLFYISFDPSGSIDEISPNDQDFVLSEYIEGSFFDDVLS